MWGRDELWGTPAEIGKKDERESEPKTERIGFGGSCKEIER